MQDRELFQWIAGCIAPWTVGEIKFASAGQRLEVQVECNDAAPKPCPFCDCMLPVCGHGEEQTWRQPDAGLWQVFLEGRPPLIECPEHGVVRMSPPWADWYVRGPERSLQGPWSLQQLKLLLDAGRILPSTLLKRSRSDKWAIAGTVTALFVRQDESPDPPLSTYELAAVDWAIANGPAVSMSIEPTASDDIATGRNASVGGPSSHSDGDRGGDSHKRSRRDRQTNQPDVTGVTPAGKDANLGQPEFDPILRLLEDSDEDAVRDSLSSLKASHPSAPRRPEKRPATRGKPNSLSRPREPAEPNPSEWDMAIEQAVEMEHTAKVVRKKPSAIRNRKGEASRIREGEASRNREGEASRNREGEAPAEPSVDNAAAQRVNRAKRSEALVRRRGFQQGYQLLTMVYLLNACLVCCLVPVVCMIFFSRLLLLSTSVFIPFEGGNVLREGQLVACGLSALSLLVLIGFPVWHLISNDGVRWHYVPSALLGMTIGFALSPDYLDEVFAGIQWCQFGFGIATAGLTVYTLSAVPARSRMSPPMIAAVLLTSLSAMVLFGVRSGSMLTVQADAVPPLFRGALPDAPLFVFGLYGTLVFIPGAILFELYRHTNFSTRQLIIRTAVMMGIYLLAGIATLGTFVNGAGSEFFDVPLALLPLACMNALAAAIPSVLLLVDPQFSLSQD